MLCVVLSGTAQTSIAHTYIQCVDSADNCIRNQNWKGAEEMTLKALRLKPASKLNALLWSNLAEIRNKLEDYDGALQAYEVGLAQDPSSTKMLCGKASIHLTRNQEDQALVDINHALELDSTLIWPRNMRGLIAMRHQDWESAEKDFQTLMQLNPEIATPYAMLGKLQVMRGNTSQAKDFLSRAIELGPEEESMFYLSLIYLDEDNLKDASTIIHDALKRFPNSGNLYLLKAALAKKSFENDKAEKFKKTAINYGADSQLIERFFPKINK